MLKKYCILNNVLIELLSFMHKCYLTRSQYDVMMFGCEKVIDNNINPKLGPHIDTAEERHQRDLLLRFLVRHDFATISDDARVHGSITLRLSAFDLLNHIQSLDDLAEDHVLAVQVGGGA